MSDVSISVGTAAARTGLPLRAVAKRLLRRCLSKRRRLGFVVAPVSRLFTFAVCRSLVAYSSAPPQGTPAGPFWCGRVSRRSEVGPFELSQPPCCSERCSGVRLLRSDLRLARFESSRTCPKRDCRAGLGTQRGSRAALRRAGFSARCRREQAGDARRCSALRRAVQGDRMDVKYCSQLESVASESLAGAIRSSTNVFHSWQCGHCQSSSVLR
jgi:hypothetical protein